MRLVEKNANLLNNYLKPFLQAPDRKPAGVIVEEARAAYRRYATFPDHYFRLGLYRTTCVGSADDYLPKSVVYELQRALNGQRFPPDLVDKRRFRAIMQAHGVACTVELFSTDETGGFIDAASRPIAAEAAKRRLLEAGGRAFLKPIDGMGGAGSAIVDLQTEDFAEAFADKADYLVQPVIEQHDLLAQIYPNSINTVRIDTLLIDGECRSSAAVLRIGSGGSIVDNIAHGGLVVPIDLRSGVLGAVGRQKPQFGLRLHETHPDTGVAFAGVKVPFWGGLRELVRSAAFALRPLATLGWDVAITPTGPIVLEANGAWDSEVFQLARGLRDTPIGQMASRKSRGR